MDGLRRALSARHARQRGLCAQRGQDGGAVLPAATRGAQAGCVCVCVCARARACVCVRVCVTCSNKSGTREDLCRCLGERGRELALQYLRRCTSCDAAKEAWVLLQILAVISRGLLAGIAQIALYLLLAVISRGPFALLKTV